MRSPNNFFLDKLVPENFDGERAKNDDDDDENNAAEETGEGDILIFLSQLYFHFHAPYNQVERRILILHNIVKSFSGIYSGNQIVAN